MDEPWRRGLNIGSGVNPDECRALYELACACPRNLKIVEIGTFNGRSLAVLTASGRHVYAVDPFEPFTNYEGTRVHPNRVRFLSMMAEHAPDASFTHIHRPSWDASEEWQLGQIGLLFIDGDHSLVGATTDWVGWRKHLAPGAVVAWHDYTLEGAGVKVVADGAVSDGHLKRVNCVSSLLITRVPDLLPWENDDVD